MRISDWSSDGCSSDLIAIAGGHSGGRGHGKQCGWPPSRGPLQAENEDMSLSDVAIRNAKPRAKPYKMGDSLGLFLLVQPSGGRLWRLKYRIDGREKKLGIGTYPEVSLSDARRRRDEAREMIAAGKDPSREKQREKLRSKELAGDTFTDRKSKHTSELPSLLTIP